MELTISVSEDLRHILEERAKTNGQDVKTFVESLVQATAARSADELPAPAPASDAEFEADMQHLRKELSICQFIPGPIRAPTSTSITTDCLFIRHERLPPARAAQ
jgi:hypothetical protein